MCIATGPGGVEGFQKAVVFLLSLQERSAKYNKRDGKVDDQSCHVDKRCHKMVRRMWLDRTRVVEEPAAA